MNESNLHTQNIVACLWDFDKTLIPGYMQSPLFEEFGIDELQFWKEVNQLPEIYQERGIRVSGETLYLNHLISYVKNGPLKGLTNKKLRELGKKLQFAPGLPHFFQELNEMVSQDPRYQKHEIKLEHYILSTGLTEMIRGSEIANYVDGIFACEFIESPLPPHFSTQEELSLPIECEISQIGFVVDNTIKTRFVFEINKGVNKDSNIDVNACISDEDRRIPIDQMIYVADGPSDVPVFSVVKHWKGKTFAVYDPDNPEAFKQADNLLQTGRIDSYGPTDYTEKSNTAMWLKMHVQQMCDDIYERREWVLRSKISQPPRHLHRKQTVFDEETGPTQETLFDE